LHFLGIKQQSTQSKNIPYHEPATGRQIGQPFLLYSTKPCFEVAETSMNGFYQLSVFSLPENIALRTAAKRWGMQSTMEQFFGTDLGLRGSGKPAVQLVSIFFLYKHLPGAKQSLSVFPLFNYRLQLQNLSLFCKNFKRPQKRLFKPNRT